MDDKITIYSFYNNKGGVGKTTLSSNVASVYAKKHPNTQVLVIDMCPQANISQFLLGGGNLGYKTNQKLQSLATRRNVVGFVDWLLKGNDNFKSIKLSYKENVSKYNNYISDNLYLIAGDSFLESLSLALNYAVINPANVNAWKNYMTSIRRLCEVEFNKDTEQQYSNMVVFIDCNPSFSIYTQMALVSSDKLIVPMMADFSSIEGIKGIMMLLYDEYPSAALKTYADNIMTFCKQVRNFNLKLPLIDRFIFNDFTTNSGIASAYESLKSELVNFCVHQYKKFPQYFCGDKKVMNDIDWAERYISDVKDFHTAGKVSASLGIPIVDLPNRSKYLMPNGKVVKLPINNYKDSVDDVNNLVNKII
jgi:cellulose biosynthesis protein BcsQ